MRIDVFLAGFLLVIFLCSVSEAQSKTGSSASRNSTARSTTTSGRVSENDENLRFTDYEERLNAILKTRRDEEKKFVNQVLLQVRAGELPEHLVETSYKWVINKRPDTNYPFVFFERVLRLHATALELEIPAFDYSIYDQRVFQSGGKGKKTDNK